MRIVRESSESEYAEWFLQRSKVSGDDRPIPDDDLGRIATMSERHKGKVRDWFDNLTKWHIVELESTHLENLGL